MAELRITDLSGQPGGRRRVRVRWQDGRALPREAEAVFESPLGARDGERIRWYLEEYPEFPADPAPTIAAETEAQLADEGRALFRALFSEPDAWGIWEQARDMLGEVRVEVDTDPGEGPGLAWELLRDPSRDAAVALGAGAFVRTHLRAAGHGQLPEPTGERLRVLLVIARPGGRADVPFRSVASRLVRSGMERMEGLDLDVLRPPTFKRLSEVLHAAQDAGRPYHVTHFDGHGTWLAVNDLSIENSEGAAASSQAGGGRRIELSPLRYGLSLAGPVRMGEHGYLLFEDPDSAKNQQLVDGPTLGRLLTDTGVPVLVLNACRSAYTQARDHPGDRSGVPSVESGTGEAAAADDSVLAGDVHARIRAYGSLAAEVADAGVPGVVAMRYNVYVVTAAQFMADLYAHLLAGKALGQAATAARRALAADPVRQIGAVPISLQDWSVPVIYESAPLVLLRPPERTVPVIRLSPAETRTGDGGGAGSVEVPRPPDAGFFGRDETLLALDRAFDSHRVVLLHAYAGAGKSSTAAEFARWYAATGGLDLPGRPGWRGVVLWSSFEHHLTADRVLGTAGDHLSGLLEANGITWAAVTDPAQRRDIVLQVLQQLPVLWVWDNVEPVTGFPAGIPSDWTSAEQDDLVELLRGLAQQTRCKVLVTSRRDEQTWLSGLPARVQMPPMPMRESLQLASAIAARRGQNLATADWRPLLRYAAGNPLAITVVAGQALRAGLATTEEIEAFVARLQAGEAHLEAQEDATLGRSRSLAASLSYGFAEAFTQAERARLAVLHLFRETASAEALRVMGNQEALGEDAVPDLAGLNRDAAIGLLDRATEIGLLESIVPGSGYYRIHPALPWYFTILFTTSYGPPDGPAAQRAARAYTLALGQLGTSYHNHAMQGHIAQAVPVLGLEETNLRHALHLARSGGPLAAAVGCLQGLRLLYERTGRNGEWARLVAAVTPDFNDPATGGPLPGRDEEWSIITHYRVRLAMQARDWATATTLQTAAITWHRDRAATALAASPARLSWAQRRRIRDLAVNLEDLGQILNTQADPDCLMHYQEALGLYQRIGGRIEEAELAINLGNVYLGMPGLRDLDQAEHWFQHSLRLRASSDQLGRAKSFGQLGAAALERFQVAWAEGEKAQVLREHLNTALGNCQQALSLIPSGDHEARAITEHQMGVIYFWAADTGQAMRHYQQSIQHKEASGDIYGAGQTRENIARLLASADRVSDALRYARAALGNYQQAGAIAGTDAAQATRLIASLEQRLR